jgi:hypothetical protein
MGKRARVTSKRVEDVPKNRVKPSEQIAPKLRRWIAITGGAGAVLLFFVLYLLRLDHVVGMFGDDAWYALLGKALATGHGLTLINSPSPGIIPIYPPAFPFLLSLMFRLAPEFPDNLWLLKSVSIAAMLGVGWLTYSYFTRIRELPAWLALGLALATALNPAFVFLATSSLMSECVFTFGLMATVVIIERGVKAGKTGGNWHYALGATLAVFTLFTRLQGVGLILAVIVYLLKERLLRAAAIFAVTTALLAGPWLLYAQMHAPTPEQQAEQNSYIVQSYLTQFSQRKIAPSTSQTATPPSLMKSKFAKLLTRAWNNICLIVEYDIGAMGLYHLFRAGEPLAGKARQVWQAALSLILTLLALTGFVAALRQRTTLGELVLVITLMIIAAWTYASFRFILPLLPFVVYYMLLGGRAIYRLVWHPRRGLPRQAEWALMGTVIACIAAFNVYSNLEYALSMRGLLGERPTWALAFEENAAVIKWVGEHLPKDAVLAAQNPALTSLYTGHKTIGNTNPSDNWENWQRLGVRYGIWTAIRPLSDPSGAQKQYPVLYRSQRMNLRVLDFGEGVSRVPWVDTP